jgi:transcriptional regulator with XRE-family HTH domain/tetratricopeptide (TPR) repeat protein
VYAGAGGLSDASGPPSFAAILRHSRLWRGWTQERLAGESTVSIRTIRDLERGTTASPRSQTVDLLAEALGLDDTARSALLRAARLADAPAEDTRTARRPAQLPRALTDYVGRDALVATLAGSLRRPGPVTPVVVTGMGGIGKTSIAVRVGHRVQPDYPDGALFLDLRGAGTRPMPAGDALTRLLRDLGIRDTDIPAEVDERSSLLRTATTALRLLMVLDNAQDAAQVRPLLPGSGQCAVIITSRNDLGGLDGVHRADLEPFSTREAWSLLAGIAGADRLAAERSAAREVIASCAGLPLALRIVGSRLAIRPGHSVRALADRLARPAVLDELTAGDLAVRASFEISFDALGEAGADPDDAAPAEGGRGVPGLALSADHAFRLLGLWPGDVLTLPAGAALLGVAPATAEAALERLVGVHLLESPQPGRYRLHDLLAAFAQERAQRDLLPEHRRAALAGLVDWYLSALDAATAVYAPYMRRYPLPHNDSGADSLSFIDAATALAWADGERTNLVAMVRTAAAAGLHWQAWMTGTLMMPYCEQRMLWPEWIATHLIARESARAEGHLLGEGRALTGLAAAYRRAGDRRTAIAFAEESLVVQRQVGDPDRILVVTGILAMIHYENGEPARAIPLLEQILADEHTSAFLQANTLLHLAMIATDAGVPAEAVVLLERGLSIAREADLPHCEVPCLHGLGRAHLGRGDPAAAIPVLTQCIERAQAIDGRIHQAEAERYLGRALAATGDLVGAGAHLATAVDLMSGLGHDDEAATRQELSDLDHAGRQFPPPQ